MANPGPSVDDEAVATPETLGSFVEARARSLAAEPYEAWDDRLPPALAGLDYESYRSIRFRPEAALWRDAGQFQIQLFHPGFIFREPVRIHLVDDEVSALPFDPALFSYDGPAAAVTGAVEEAARGTGGYLPGYSGFRVHYPLNRPDRMDEVIVFQGASYFRLVGPGQVYGLSSRGLAVDIASGKEEEFPDFREFWLVRPAPDADSLVIHALLDAPSVTGAYRFVLAPGEATEVRVDARLFAREDVGKLGVAPLSSMFLFDANLAGDFDDFRAAVHDSDGLLVRTRKEEWIWRPLGNLRGLRVTSLRDVDPRGFGLAQRARRFEDYLDLEARYHQRPSVWTVVADDDRWGRGGVELLEIPTESEFNDNVAAYWVPDEPFRAGETRRYRYTLRTYDDRLPEQSPGQVERTRMGWAALPGETDPPPRSHRRFAIDFRGGRLSDLAPDAEPRPVAETLAGSLADLRVQRLPGDGRWRVSFRLEPDPVRPADMRVYLTLGDEALTETWSYAWYPEEER